MGQVDIGWLDRVAANGKIHLCSKHADVALVQAAIECIQRGAGSGASAVLCVRCPRSSTGAERHRPHAGCSAIDGHLYSIRIRQRWPERLPQWS